jgi:hypothetical protein
MKGKGLFYDYYQCFFTYISDEKFSTIKRLHFRKCKNTIVTAIRNITAALNLSKILMIKQAL